MQGQASRFQQKSPALRVVFFPKNLAFPNPYLLRHPKRKRPMRQKDALKIKIKNIENMVTMELNFRQMARLAGTDCFTLHERGRQCATLFLTLSAFRTSY